jgi:6-phosphogluconolactonase
MITMISLAILITPTIFVGINHSYSQETFVYVSNGEDGNISIFELEPDTGDMEMVNKVPAEQKVMHMAISPDDRFLYASIRAEPFSVITYLINPETGNLSQISKELLPANMVYISVDQTGRFLLSVSYNEAKIAVNPINLNGTVQPHPVQIISTGAKPHSILSDSSNRFVYVPHLGTSQIKQFLFDENNGTLVLNKPGVINTKDSSGPRHLYFSPNNKFVYVSNEIDGTVYAYELDNKTGVLKEIQRISAMPRNFSLQYDHEDTKTGTGIEKVTNLGVADIHITPDGRWLYVSERESNTIAAFAVDSESGMLTYVQNYKTEKIPRAFNIDPRGHFVIVAGQESGYISIYEINQDTGELNYLDKYESGKSPNWIEIVGFDQGK